MCLLKSEFETILTKNKTKEIKKMNKTKFLSRAAIIAALYVCLTFLSSLLGLSSGVIQVRFSEALTILPVFSAAAIPGLFAGCIISNIITGCALWDVVFGSIATLLGAVFTYLFRKNKYIGVIPPIFFNTLIIPFVLVHVYGVPDALWFVMLTVGIGEVISCGILGLVLHKVLFKHKDIFQD